MNQPKQFSIFSLLLGMSFFLPSLASAQVCGIREGYHCCQDLTPELVQTGGIKYCINKLDGAKDDLSRTPQFFKVTKAKSSSGSVVGQKIRQVTKGPEKLVTELRFKEMTADEMLKAGLLEVKGTAQIPSGGIGMPVLGEIVPSRPQAPLAAPVVQVSTEISYICNLPLISMCRKEVAKDLAACEVGDLARINCLKPSETFECKVTTKNCSQPKEVNGVRSCNHLPGHEEVKSARSGDLVACLKVAKSPALNEAPVQPELKKEVSDGKQ